MPRKGISPYTRYVYIFSFKKEATYVLIPEAECRIDTELQFIPEIELCAAHQFSRPTTGVFQMQVFELLDRHAVWKLC